MGDFARLPDDELLALTAKQPEAFGEFYARHVRAVLGFARHEGLRTDEALDLTAEVFAAALLASRRYRPGEAPARAWLLGIARNKLAHGRRRAATETSARRKLGMARLTYSDEALERVEELLDAEVRAVHERNGRAAAGRTRGGRGARDRGARVRRDRSQRPARPPPPCASG